MARLGVCKIMMEVLEFYSIMHRSYERGTNNTHLNWVEEAKDGTKEEAKDGTGLRTPGCKDLASWGN